MPDRARRMRRPVSTPEVWDDDFGVFLESAVAGGVVGDAVLPAAPQDAAPGAADGSDRTWVVVSAVAGAQVMVLSPGVPFAGRVGECRGSVAESVVTASSEARNLSASGFDGDGAHAGVSGEL